MLQRMTRILGNLTVNVKRMDENLMVTRGLIFSQKMLLFLVDRGLTREDAYKAVQDAAMRTWHGERDFLTELLEEKSVAENFKREELEKAFDVEPYLKHVKAIFARCGIEL